jgi:hypothetical protein
VKCECWCQHKEGQTRRSAPTEYDIEGYGDLNQKVRKMGNYISYISLGISLIALLFSGIGLSISYNKYKIEKSKLHVRVQEIVMDSLTAMYPSMEDDDSKYKMYLWVENAGYKEERINQIVGHCQNRTKIYEISRVIAAKTGESFELEFSRLDIMSLKKIEIIPLEDKKIVIREREFFKWKKEIVEHIDKLSEKWKDGKMIS